MKKTCPSCNKNFAKRLIKSKTLARKDNIKETVFICPYCKVALVPNRHKSENKYQNILIATVLFTVLPAFIIKGKWGVYILLIGSIGSILLSIIMIRNENVKLKNWSRWKIFNK